MTTPGQFDSNKTPSLEPVAALVDPSRKVILLSSSLFFPRERQVRGYQAEAVNILWRKTTMTRSIHKFHRQGMAFTL